MSPHFTILLMLCVTVLGASAQLLSNDGKAIQQKYLAKTGLVEGSLQLPERCTASSCPIQITVTNVSERTFYFFETSQVPLLQISLTDSKGELCPLTEKGKRFYDKDRPPMDLYSSLVVWLEKGQPKSSKLDLAEHFKLTPGEWTLSLSLFLGEERAADAPEKRTLNKANAIPPVEFKDIRLTVDH